ncbi:ABC-2 type transport system ATP-binding protein [Clostridium amylolyticum]|uniref:ABC-2 type transport system ATP-binding protein n=1 Tax=Clostridium amylolyticum TaxID=1121298 RepID=A0A1M6HFN2_9CLOT|nr:ATP-binding cassette domain-containing protein [Clostridium amylolyticum]SHJ20985.1 ABC-2 type transport system ATP-binding protein [Clostridium amylolyticum]
MKNIIEINNLKKSYGDFQAVKDVSFSVKKGEIFGFLGPNGAGKSTTINMLSTMIKPSSGDASINGFNVSKERDKVRESIGIIFQENTLDEKLTAYENLMLHCKLYGVEKSVREERINEVLDMVELSDKKENLVKTFSGGMKRRLEIARGLLHYPKVIFLDEPTVGLDPQTRDHIWSYILKLKEREGITVFLTTHYMDEAEFCDRIAIIDDGRIIALETPESLKNSLGGDIMEISTKDNDKALKIIKDKYNKNPKVKNGIISFNVLKGNEFLVDFVKDFEIPIDSVNLRRPTLNDVFLGLTGREIREESSSSKPQNKKGSRK